LPSTGKVKCHSSRGGMGYPAARATSLAADLQQRRVSTLEPERPALLIVLPSEMSLVIGYISLNAAQGKSICKPPNLLRSISSITP
jgi:hypothetical protein